MVIYQTKSSKAPKNLRRKSLEYFSSSDSLTRFLYFLEILNLLSISFFLHLLHLFLPFISSILPAFCCFYIHDCNHSFIITHNCLASLSYCPSYLAKSQHWINLALCFAYSFYHHLLHPVPNHHYPYSSEGLMRAVVLFTLVFLVLSIVTDLVWCLINIFN